MPSNKLLLIKEGTTAKILHLANERKRKRQSIVGGNRLLGGMGELYLLKIPRFTAFTLQVIRGKPALILLDFSLFAAGPEAGIFFWWFLSRCL